LLEFEDEDEVLDDLLAVVEVVEGVEVGVV
jgi:hypothetical protein